MNMRIHPLTLVPLFLAFIGLMMAVFTAGTQIYLIIGLAVATILVAIATLFQYSRSSYEAKQVPLENFSIWADVGEPAAELRRLNFDDIGAAVRIAAADLGSLSANSELLGARISMLLGKEGFEDIRQEKLHQSLKNLASSVNAIVEKLRATNKFPAETVTSLEQCASQSDRIANKLFEFERGKSEVVRIYIEPLRRAAEKLSRDFRLASANLASFTFGMPAKETGT
jgi:hypothetical protein